MGLPRVHPSLRPVIPRPGPACGAVIRVADLGLDASGSPTTPVVVVDLDSESSLSEIERLRSTLRVVVGVSHDVPPPSADPLLSLATVSLATHVSDSRVVAVADPPSAANDIVAAVRRTPLAAVTLAALLRQTAVLDVADGLAAESAAYSTLLAGPEFAAWLAARGPARRRVEDAPPVLVERDGDVLRVRLNRPHRRNAVDAGMRDALVEALAVAVADPDLSVEISGAGPHFSSGGDLDEFGTAPDPATAHVVRSEQSVGRVIDSIRDRVTAVVHGSCIGAGVEIPAFAGRLVARPDATFRLPELGLGLVPGAGGTVSVTQRIGRWRTAWLALTGSDVNVATALEWGLVDAVEPDLHRERTGHGTD